jgi:hypothetical protein
MKTTQFKFYLHRGPWGFSTELFARCKWEGNVGVRPSDIGTPGHLAATTKHLEDMRTIAFAALEVAKP